MSEIDFSKQKIAVLGLGNSGYESALFLRKQGAAVFASESQSNEMLQKRKRELEAAGIEVEVGRHSYDRILGSDRVVISPGISPKSEVYQQLERAKIPMWSEIELAYRFCPAPIIAVTGTNGKTTVTTIISKLLSDNGLHSISCGNIGNPFIGEVSKLNSDSVAVVEVSSFQLQNISAFRPHIAILLNLTDNHFDWHGTFENYAKAKWRIFENQMPHDYAVINVADAESMRRVGSIKSQTIYFNAGEFENPNFAACFAVAGLYRLDERKVRKTFREFRGIKHRMEEIPSQDGIRYINDSKSTTIASLKWALDRTKQKVILIMGGRHKGGDFSQLRDVIKQKVRFLIVLGEASEIIEQAFASAVTVSKAPSLVEAVRHARAVARQGDTVLFSPACASFDMFRDYQDRGDQFKETVSRLQYSNSEPALESSVSSS